MALYAAFLRGINVGGHRVAKGDLVRVFEELGFDDVTTFRASGNVIFGSPRKPSVEKIEEALEKALGYAAPVCLRSATELRAIARKEPFPAAEVEASKGKLQVSMLKKKPGAAVKKRVLALASDEDRLAFGDRELYWLPSGGTMESPLDQETIAKLVGGATMRTMGTVEQIASRFFDL